MDRIKSGLITIMEWLLRCYNFDRTGLKTTKNEWKYFEERIPQNQTRYNNKELKLIINLSLKLLLVIGVQLCVRTWCIQGTLKWRDS